MKNNDRLFDEIGALDDEMIPSVTKEGNKRSAALRLLGGTAAAAAVAGFVITQNLGTADDPWADYRIYPADAYTKNVVVSEPPKVSYELKHVLIYWDEEMEAASQFHIVSDISDLDNNNPWNEDTELAYLPVFKSNLNELNIAFYSYYNEEELTQMLENTVKALGVTITESEFSYEDFFQDPDNEKDRLPEYLSAYCGSEEYGDDLLYITVYGDGNVRVSFEGDGLELPEEYSHDIDDAEGAEKTLSYIAERFKNLLQFEDPVSNTYISRADEWKSREYSIYNGSEDIVQSILNYNLAHASLQISENKLMSINLGNRMCVSDCIGEYPVISVETAYERLFKGQYLKRFPDSFFKDGSLKEEDVKKAELVYTSVLEDYFKPYYHFYVEVKPLSYLDGSGLKMYGDIYVPAIAPEYIKSNYESPALSPDFNGEAIDAYPAEEVIFPDGSSAAKTEAARIYGNDENPFLEYNFGFLRYSKPIFQSTLDDPDCYSYDTNSFTDPVDENITDPDYFRVQAGDVLENGMRVESATYKVTWKDGKQSFVESNITLSGDILFEGILLCRQPGYGNYEVVFYPDPTAAPTTVFCSSSDDGTEQLATVVLDETAFVTDSKPILLESYYGYTDEANEFYDIFPGTKGVKAQVKFNKLYYTVTETGANTTCEYEEILR